MKYSLVIAVAICVLAGAVACNKETTTPAEETPKPFVPDFTFSGKQHVYAPIVFTSNFPDDMQLTWDFGNGDKETVQGKSITYSYKDAGNYNVTMSIADSFGGAVFKEIFISNGPERVGGKHNWNFFLKGGHPVSVVPVKTFNHELKMEIVNDTTIRIPDIAQLRVRGPYTVKKYIVDAEKLVYRSDDAQVELSYTFNSFTAGMKIIQAHRDTVWTLTGVASIYN
ncbi:MAG TPA: PKD domain-containing protein [Flavipsychrobacter sp.]